MKNKNKDTKSQAKKSQDSKIPLNDYKQNGKKRPWDKNKAYSCAVAEAFKSIPGLESHGEKIENCGNYLEMAACANFAEHGKVLRKAFFCRIRNCITCQWLRSLTVQNQMLELAKEHLKKYPTDVPILCTPTVLNVKGDEIGKTLDKMNGGWKRFMELKPIKRVVRSAFKSFEIPYNRERDDFHPHFHSILMVPASYFRKERELYIARDEYLRMWQQSMRDDRITQFDVRVFKPGKKGALESLVAEVAKYATKPDSYISTNEHGKNEVDTKVAEALYYGLRGRRLVSYWGYFNKIRKQKKMMDLGEPVSCKDSCSCKICNGPMVDEDYLWSKWDNRYWGRRVPKEEKDNEEKPEPFVKKKPPPSILLRALKKSIGRGQEPENDNYDEPIHEIERIQCRGPT